MKTRVLAFVCYALVTVGGFADSYTLDLPAGASLIANQLDHGSNTLNQVLPDVPDGSELYKYNNGAGNWTASAFSAAGAWVNGDAITLSPGEGAFFQSPTNFTLTFTGTPHVPVLPVSIPGGVTYLLSRQTNGLGNYTNIVGTVPPNHAKIFKWDGTGYTVGTYNLGAWSSGGPTGPEAAVGEAVWIAPAGGAPPAITVVPLITRQPSSLVVTQGDPAAFTVTAIGTAPLNYQWLYFGQPMAGGTNASLVFANARSTDAGDYSVVVSNSFGSVASTVVTLTLPLDVNVWIADGTDLSTVQADFIQQGAVILGVSDYFRRISCRIPPGTLAQFAGSNYVQRIDPVGQPATFNETSRGEIHASNVQAPPWGTVNLFNLSGANVRLGIWDGGIPDQTHPDLAGHVTVMENDAAARHPTHVAGTMAGTGVAWGQEHHEAGVAPNAPMFAWSFNSFDPSPPTGWPSWYWKFPFPQDEMKDAATDPQYPIVISQNSWGNPPMSSVNCFLFGNYWGVCADYDRLVRQENLSIVFAAGNSQDGLWKQFDNQGQVVSFGSCGLRYFETTALPAGYSTVTPPGTSKNVVTVGAVTKWDAMTEFSSWGPTRDGRLKPDVVAVGLGVISCATPWANSLPFDIQNYYLTMNGTSMAAPQVSGGMALLTEQYRISHANSSVVPKPALLKAVLCNTAADLGNPGPDYKFGYGRIDLARAAAGIRDQRYVEQNVGLNTLETADLAIEVSTPCELRVLIAWTDAECTNGCIPNVHDLVNDLDLVLIDPNGGTHLPLTLDPANPSAPAAAQANHRDNVEQVVVANPIPGTWTARVTGYSVTRFGPQAYAITWDTNCPDVDEGLCHSFEHSAQGWTAVDRVNGVTGIHPNPNFLDSGGIPGGCIAGTDDGDGHDWYFRAPARLSGDRSSWYGGTMDFDLWSDDFYFYASDSGVRTVILGDGTTEICYHVDMPNMPNTWFHFSVPLTGNGGSHWHVSSSGAEVGEVQFQHILSGLVFIDILGEYGNGPDHGRLDNFCIQSPCISLIFADNKSVPCTSNWDFDAPTNIVDNCCSNFSVSFSVVTNSSACPLSVTGTWIVTDPCGNSNICRQTITVTNVPTVITCPNTIVVTSCTATQIFYTVTASNPCCPDLPPPVCTPQSGSTFAPGTTTIVRCTATDCCANTYSNTFAVVVLNGLPTISCPSNIVVDCTNEAGAIVAYPLPFVTGAIGPPGCSPASGSHFPIGITSVVCTATNSCGQIATCIFTVTVRGYGKAVGHWAHSRFGNGPLTRGSAIAVDRSGNVFVGGTFAGSLPFCGPVSVWTDGNDGFLAKYDTSGNLLWARRIGGPGSEEVRGVAVDSQGNCCVIGNFDGATANFPMPCEFSSPAISGAGNGDVFLAKYSANGDRIWWTSAGGPGADVGESVALDDADDCYITGAFTQSATFGTKTVNGTGLNDCFLARYSSFGVCQWAVSSAGTGIYNVHARGVAVDSLRHAAVITGFFGNNATFGAAPPLGPTTGYGNAFVAQLNFSNPSNPPAWTWARQTFCPNGSPVCGSHDGQAVGMDANGACYFTAYFVGTAAIGAPAAPVVDFFGPDQYNYLVGKFDFDGNPQWLVRGLAPGDSEPRGLAVERNSGDVYVTGLANGLDLNADGGSQVTLFKYNSSGTMIWSQDVLGSSSSQDNAGRSVALDPNGCVYITGSFTDINLQFLNFLTGVIKLSALQNTTKMFVAKYCPSCSSNCLPAVITVPLQNAFVSSGPSPANPVNFTVTVNGTPPIYFQWFRNGVLLPAPGGPVYTITPSPDGMSSTLRLTGVPGGGAYDNGTYSVYAGNSCCDCTMASSHASIFRWIIGGGGGQPFDSAGRFQLGILAPSGVSYRVEYRDNLNPGTPWQFLTNATGTGSNDWVFDPNPGLIMRFYRIPLEPDP